MYGHGTTVKKIVIYFLFSVSIKTNIVLNLNQVEKTLAASKECREKELKEHTADLQKR